MLLNFDLSRIKRPFFISYFTIKDQDISVHYFVNLNNGHVNVEFY